MKKKNRMEKKNISYALHMLNIKHILAFAWMLLFAFLLNQRVEVVQQLNAITIKSHANHNTSRAHKQEITHISLITLFMMALKNPPQRVSKTSKFPK